MSNEINPEMNIELEKIVNELINNGIPEDEAIKMAEDYLSVKQSTKTIPQVPFKILSINTKDPDIGGFNKFVSTPIYNENNEKTGYKEILGDTIKVIPIAKFSQVNAYNQFKSTIEPPYTRKIDHYVSGMKLEEYAKINNIDINKVQLTTIFLFLKYNEETGNYEPYIHYATPSRSIEINKNVSDREYGLVEIELKIIKRNSPYGKYTTIEVKDKRKLTNTEINEIKIPIIKTISEFKRYIDEFNAYINQ